MTIAAVSLALGLPAVADVIDRSRLRTASADLEFAARMARSEALKRNTTVTLQVETQHWEVRTGVSPNTVVLHQGNLGPRILAAPASIDFSGSGFTLPTGARLDLDLALASDPTRCAQAGTCRRLQVDAGGAARVCDPRKSVQEQGACT